MSSTVEKLIAEYDDFYSTEEKVDALNTIAWELRDNDLKRGLNFAKKAQHLAEEIGYHKGVADSLISQSQYIFSDFIAALNNGYQALTIYERLEDIKGQSRALYTLCWAHWFADNFVEAIEFGQKAQKLAQEIKDIALEADILNNLGLAYKRAGNFDLGYTVYRQSLELYHEAGDSMREGKVLINMALAYGLEGKFDRALDCVHERMKVHSENPLVDGYMFLALGKAYVGKKQHEQALHNLNRALDIARTYDLEQLSQTALHTLGQLYIEQNKPVLATSYFQRALDQAVKIESSLSKYRCHELLSQIYEAQGDYLQALDHYKKFHEIKESLFNEKSVGRLQFLQIYHDAEIARREAEIHQLRNVELEQEISERKSLEAKLYIQATTDELTSVSNRRHFLNLAEIEMKQALKQQQPLSLALIDIDEFKHINDTYGHAIGDQVLVAVAKICGEKIRDFDVFARLGGDEFVILLPNTDSEQALRVVESVHLALTRNQISLFQATLTISVSFGVATLISQNYSFENLLAVADQALYQAKEAGRNCISVEILN